MEEASRLVYRNGSAPFLEVYGSGLTPFLEEVNR
jgi:hypothetical protein